MAAPLTPIRGAIDWGTLAPLRLRARQVADGLFAGAHRSARRGAGVEFAGHRVYVPGDELRFIDVRASMRHERVVVRHFETETERALRLVVDATLSMAFRSSEAPGAKVAFAALIAASLARVSLAAGDPVGLDWIGGEGGARRVPPSARGETFERIIATLEGAVCAGDARRSIDVVDRAIESTIRGARRGSAIVLLSDLLDLPDGAIESVAALGARGRPVVAVEILDPQERRFPFEGPVVLRAIEAGPNDRARVQTDGPAVRSQYLARLEARGDTLRATLGRHGGTLVRATTDDDPVEVVRATLHAIAGDAAAMRRDSARRQEPAT